MPGKTESVFEFWLRPLTTLALIALAGLVAWAAVSATVALAVVALGCLLLVVFHLQNLAALERWLREPELRTMPHGLGIWEGAFAGLYELLRTEIRSHQTLAATLERFQAAVKALPDALVVLDRRDRIEWCNSMAEAYLGLDSARDQGQQISYLLRQPQFSGYLSAQHYAEPLLLRSQHARETVFSIRLVPYGEEQKLLIVRDVTQREHVEAMRRDFVANVSHEMRTPLTVVGGFLETLIDTPSIDPAQARHYLELMHAQTQRMQRLVEDLLTLSRLENTNTPLTEEEVDVRDLLDTLEDEARALSRDRHAIHVEIKSECTLLGNARELTSAFSNLVSNAVRYTPDGGDIWLRWEKKGVEGVFSVKDTGEGIEAQHIPRLTERFYRIDRSRSRETGGTGLGLAIVKHVLSRHQGHLVIDSQPGRGSTFSAHFPARRLRCGAAANPSPQTSADSSASA